jgi:hypothetical protein
MKHRIPDSSLLFTVLALTLFVLISMQVDAAPKRPVRRIRFKPGATTATVKGRLTGWNDVARFVLRVRPHQHMHVSVESAEIGNPQIDVTFPSGGSMDRDMQGTQFDTDSTEAGDYQINVYEGRKADPSNGTFTLRIEVN